MRQRWRHHQLLLKQLPWPLAQREQNQWGHHQGRHPLSKSIQLPQQRQQLQRLKNLKSAPEPDMIPESRLSGGAAAPVQESKRPSTSRSQKPMVSPKARPPPRIAPPRLSIPATTDGDGGTPHTPKSTATDDTIALEDKLQRKRDAKTIASGA